jgi:epoxyqueuosine reductase
MSVFHSTVSRRQFMKVLGIAGAGVGGAALVAPAFHDLDEVAAAGDTMQKHPWYVKERERLDPAVEIDWDLVARYDRRQMGQSAYIRAKYYGKDFVEKVLAGSAALQKQRMVDNVAGFGHKWEALRTGLSQSNSWSVSFLGPEVSGKINATTPEALGVPKWVGTPEENSKMLIAAIRLFGMAELGSNNLDSTWRNKLVAFNEKGSSTGTQWISTPPEQMPASAARPIVYENVDQPYYTSDKWVIPTNKELNVIYIGGPEPRETDRTYPSRISKSNLVANSGTRNVAWYSTYNFMRALGYNMFGGTGHGTDCFQTPGVAVLTGKAENARMSNWVISGWGPRSTDLAQITDMPLAETHPIDAGKWKFCQTCGICADTCPSNSIPKLDYGPPTYEMPAIEGKPDTQHATGMKRYVFNGSSCNLYPPQFIPGSGCSACAANCTFSTGEGAMVHEVLKSTVANVGVFNGFLATMGRTFGYGAFKDPEEWWNSSLPQFGINSTFTALDGGYRK